ncbi:plasmid partitioning protein RepB [Roseibium sp. TrichSKD4]|uniref:plasmid partitioning protein RepB n=1 Tax=Roseibium sp. TrichSKD4 TaxID=744980 RepID=UPI0001E565E2|nr:plasmid partitioning protein RepB [Roseibium sp. TrichSKD4]EFO34017.1 plasmid partitioning protein RepB [Roseibium sp. TrichSKD4]
MTKRKDRLKALFTGTEAPDLPKDLETKSAKAPGKPQAAAYEKRSSPKTGPSPAPADAGRSRSASGAVKAMGLSLGQMAEELQEQTGERIVELEPNHIEPSPVADRITLEANLDDGFAELVESLKTRGQQVPVMVRRHADPTKAAEGWYQAAYGHRRIRAARELGLKVRAIVRDLSDDALILAQGKENSERRDLSFIERAFFARSLIEHGISRAMIQEALSIHKTEMTRLLQVADKVPYPIARAIGPAPKAGRPRWLELAELIDGEAAEVIAQDEIMSESFLASGSDTRFKRLHARLLNRRSKKPSGDVVNSRAGVPMAEVKGTAIRLAKSVPKDFTQFVANRLPDLLEAYEAERKAPKKSS